MAYPRLLNLDDEVKDKLKSYLNEELTQHRAERTSFDQKLIMQQEDYWAEPPTEVNDFPFKGAANIIIPLTAIAFESVHASTMATIYGLKQLVNVSGKTADMMDFAKAFEDYVNYDLVRNVNFKDKTESSIIEVEKYGTGFGKARYEELVRYGVRTIEGVEMDIPITYKKGATVDTVSISRFIMPFSSLDPQEAPWCGETHEMGWAEVNRLEESGYFYEGTSELLKDYFTASATQENEFTDSQRDLESTRPILPSTITFQELWLSYEIDGGDTKKEIQVIYHFDSQYFLAIRYNDYSDLRRPYRFGRYVRVENRLYGIGIAQQNEQFQAEITVQHRQRLDNATIANIRMFKLQKNSGYGPKEPIFPGKMWFLDDLKDIEAFQAGEIYPSAYNNEQQSLIYSQQRTGVNELTLGMPNAGTPGTATDSMTRIQESKKKFDYVMNNIKAYLNDLVVDIYDVQQQYGPRHLQYYDVVEGGDMVKQVLAMPSEYIRDCLMFDIRMIGDQTNEIVDRQNWTQISGMLTQYYQQMIGIAQQTGNKELLQMFSQKALLAGTEVAKQMLESFDIKNIERVLPIELLRAGNNAGKPNDGSGDNGATGDNQIGSMGPPEAPSPPSAP